MRIHHDNRGSQSRNYGHAFSFQRLKNNGGQRKLIFKFTLTPCSLL